MAQGDSSVPCDMYGSIACAASPKTTTLPENHLESGVLLSKGHLVVF